MRLLCGSFENLQKRINDKNQQIIMFGAGAIGTVSIPEILKRYDLLNRIDCYIDNNESLWGNRINAAGKECIINPPSYLKACQSNVIIFLNISRFSSVLNQLEKMECTASIECCVMPMMLIHNYCLDKSYGEICMAKEQLIPKKIHYMWLGGKPLPDSLKRCIDSWYRFCPDYEIIQWNERNYDIAKHPYMKQAYEHKSYGFLPDYARLDILYNEGGLYLDTDVEIKRSIDDLLYQEAFCGVEKWQIINFGGLSGAVQGHPMIKRFLDAREKVSFVDEDGNPTRITCGIYDTPIAINAGYKINGKNQCICGMNIYAYDYFHPYDYMSGIINETENTYSIHWFNGGWLDEKMKLENEHTKLEYLKLYEKAKAL